MKRLLKNPAQIITVDTGHKNVKRGQEMNEVGKLESHSIIIENDKIKALLPNTEIDKIDADETIDLSGKVILPGLVECHTHTVFAGSRADEFREKLTGTGYEEIAKRGGGINATVEAVRRSSFDELMEVVKARVEYFISQGVTTLEIKSGYGLSFYDEIKLLQVIISLNDLYEIDIIPTFLGAHTFPKEYKNDHSKYMDIILNELLPYVSEKKLAEFCDVFCEETAFSAEQTDEIFGKASELGLKLKLHTEQFNNIGGLATAVKHKAVSVDHLEVLAESDLKLIAESDTTAVLLPGVSFFLDYDFAPARKLIDNNAIVALATDYNPGSSHISNLNFIMSLAALKMKMTIEEIISAYTINAAHALGRQSKIGSIEPGKQADFAVFNTNEYADIIYNVGKNLNCMTIKNGSIIFKN